MGLKKIKKQIKALTENAYWKGWSSGWEKAYETVEDEAYENGWKARGENVQTRLKMLEEGYMLEGKGAKAVMVRELAELIAIEIKTGEVDNDDF